MPPCFRVVSPCLPLLGDMNTLPQWYFGAFLCPFVCPEKLNSCVSPPPANHCTQNLHCVEGRLVWRFSSLSPLPPFMPVIHALPPFPALHTPPPFCTYPPSPPGPVCYFSFFLLRVTLLAPHIVLSIHLLLIFLHHRLPSYAVTVAPLLFLCPLHFLIFLFLIHTTSLVTLFPLRLHVTFPPIFVHIRLFILLLLWPL